MLFRSRLWIGTYSGLNVLDKRTGEVRKIENAELSSTGISQILVTSDQRILFATEIGLYEYKEIDNSFLAYDTSNTGGGFPRATISLYLRMIEEIFGLAPGIVVCIVMRRKPVNIGSIRR